MPKSAKPFDPAQHLKTPQARAAFMGAAQATGDAEHVAFCNGVVARSVRLHRLSDAPHQASL